LLLYNRDENFKCNSGECLHENYLCDGKEHCTDGSDENISYCAKISCPSYAFRCGYGACISKKTLCNGLIECKDGSDEFPTICTEADRNKAAEQLDTSSPIPVGETIKKPSMSSSEGCSEYVY